MSNKNFPVIHNIRLHLAWHTKGQAPMLDAGIEHRLRELLAQDCKAYGVSILGGNIGSSHVHMRVSCPPKLSPSAFIGELKGRSSRLLGQEFPHLKDGRPSGELWETGYFCCSYGEETDSAALTEYIGSQ